MIIDNIYQPFPASPLVDHPGLRVGTATDVAVGLRDPYQSFGQRRHLLGNGARFVDLPVQQHLLGLIEHRIARRVRIVLAHPSEPGDFQGSCPSGSRGCQFCFRVSYRIELGYRVYYTRSGNDAVILLAGGDKSSQSEDIEVAKGLARDLEG